MALTLSGACVFSTPARATVEQNSWGQDSIATSYEEQWAKYKRRFVRDDGRVVDTGNNGITHSESQGTGMIFSIHANDRYSFEKIWNWTKAHLRRQDNLFIWKYDPNISENKFPDHNNATDGDLLIAWSLLLAAQKWDKKNLIHEAKKTIRALEAKVIESFAGKIILRPGELGFTGYKKRILNVSYCIFPALKEIARYVHNGIWKQIYTDCLTIVTNTGFGDHALPLDWVSIDGQGKVAPAPRKPARFGYDAIRVPLYLVWAGHSAPTFIQRYDNAWERYGRNTPPPGWIDPITGHASAYRERSGYLAVRTLVEFATKQSRAQKNLREMLPQITRQDDYYSASLALFAALAATELQS